MRDRALDAQVLGLRSPWSVSDMKLNVNTHGVTIRVEPAARQVHMPRDGMDGIMLRAVERGLAHRQLEVPTAMDVDETSFQKRHEYMIGVVDAQRSRVLHVADDRKSESLAATFGQSTAQEQQKIEVVSMDMHEPYVKATREAIPDADPKKAFDKFHVAKHLGDAVDRVRRQEHAALMAKGDWTLNGTKYVWLTNPANINDTVAQGMIEAFKAMHLKTAIAWALQECAIRPWHFTRRGWATKAWGKWISQAQRSRLPPVMSVAGTTRRNLWKIVNAIVLGETNAVSVSINTRIQWIKRMACGFRNRERFRNAISFHLGGRDLYPAAAGFTHTKA